MHMFLTYVYTYIYTHIYTYDYVYNIYIYNIDNYRYTYLYLLPAVVICSGSGEKKNTHNSRGRRLWGLPDHASSFQILFLL